VARVIFEAMVAVAPVAKVCTVGEFFMSRPLASVPLGWMMPPVMSMSRMCWYLAVFIVPPSMMTLGGSPLVPKGLCVSCAAVRVAPDSIVIVRAELLPMGCELAGPLSSSVPWSTVMSPLKVLPVPRSVTVPVPSLTRSPPPESAPL